MRNGDALIADASEMVAGYERGLTPNPDILCNLRIKFGTFITRAAASKHSYIATGHYAQTEHHSAQEASLLRSVDEAKDQTYFLAGLAPGTLSRVCFPVGHLHKASVRMIAELEGFVSAAQRKESMGICFFIGKRQFPEFIREYIAPSAGDIVDLDRRPIARHAGLYTHAWAGRKHPQPAAAILCRRKRPRGESACCGAGPAQHAPAGIDCVSQRHYVECVAAADLPVRLPGPSQAPAATSDSHVVTVQSAKQCTSLAVCCGLCAVEAAAADISSTVCAGTCAVSSSSNTRPACCAVRWQQVHRRRDDCGKRGMTHK